MQHRHTLNKALQAFLITASMAVTLAVNAVTWPNVPLGSTTSATPMTMLVASKDHKLFYEAYNDASDIGGAVDGGPDGKLDTRFDPKITYYGLYDSALCYKYDETDKMHVPTMVAGVNGVCRTTNANWSGNWLNYVTTSRIDALRKVLYGGFREIDEANKTVLRRAYIPQDAHTWAKEYTSIAVDGYDIRDYSPFDVPVSGERIFFGSLTPNAGVNCSTLNNCSGIAPALRVMEKVNNGKRVWDWASTERPVLRTTIDGSNATWRTADDKGDFQIRVQVCTGAFLNGCKQYPDKGYKPVGLLHDYGENNSMLFGLMTGSYDKSMSGGRLRKIISSFSDEVDKDTGIFKSKMSPAGLSPIVQSFDNLRIRDFNNGNSSNQYKGGWLSNAPMTEGGFPDWGNPIGEILYEATRYFSGKKSPTSDFAGTSTIDGQVGLGVATWDDPYKNNSAQKVASCSKANFLTISDTNPSFDSDQLPGSYFNSMSSDLTGLNVSTRADTITAVESNITGLRFIGRSGSLDDKAPSAKTVTSLGSVRGLAPEEPTRQGSYYVASVAYHAKTTDLRPTTDLPGDQTVDNFVVALSSPLPKIEIKMPNDKLITLIPFGKSVNQYGISSGKNDFQPTNQIVDFYVEEIVNQTQNEDTSKNGGRYSATFRVNFEDVEQGADHDMDVIVQYVVKANSTGGIDVTVTPTYQAGSIQQNLGYVISGTTADGVYLVAQDESNTPGYYLNVPKGKTPGYCNAEPMPTDCSGMPNIGKTANLFTFVAGTGTGATLLKDPLWYAAKYGAFNDRNKSGTPDSQLEWDGDKNGVPDTYFLVQNPLKLKEALKKAFDSIIERRGSGSNVIANSTALSTNSFAYQGIFNSTNWSGDLEAYNVNSSGVDSNLKWKASEKIPAPEDRNITFGRSSPPTVGVLQTFTWTNLNPTEKTLLDNDSNLLDFLRGVRTYEVQNATGAIKGEFRSRAPNNVLGDIAHSSPFYVKDTDTVYVGANGGMLHAFNGTTGQEQFAHIPSPMMPKLKLLANPAYVDNHQYFVDGDIAVSSVAQTSSNFLVATMGRGAKGLFGLDVSTPTNFKTSQILWEYADVVSDPDLGFMLGRPVIAKLQSGVWAVIVGNGYNSTSGKAVLYVFNLATGALIQKIDTGVGSDNGMASPGVRLNAAGVAETVYAGDLKGNVWKFDISSTTSANWKIPTALGSNPLFVAKDSASKSQSITAPIRFAINTVAGDANFGKFFVHFGTGSDFQATDPANTDVQSWYGVIDDGVSAPVRSNLITRVMGVATTLNNLLVRSMSVSTSNDMLGKSGFVIDMPEGGERIVTASNYYQLAEPVLIASSLVPTVDLCQPGGKGYINAINPFTGARLTKGFFDVTGDGGFLDADSGVSSVDLDIGKPSEAILIGNRLVVGGSKAQIEDILINAGNIPKGRISWREIIRD